MALETFPPAKLVCFRFLLSGSVMVLYALSRGHSLPKGRDLAGVCLTGLLTLGVGNGAVVFAETWIPSGITGLIITIAPFWMVGAEALLPGGERLHLPTIAGMVVGMGGAAMLFAPEHGQFSIDRGMLAGFLVLQVGMAGWSFGSILQRRRPGQANPVIIAAIQQLAVGVAMIPFAALAPAHAIHWSGRGVGAILYLVMFGSIVGYTAYMYALDKLPVAIVSVYPYVNAVVAVAIGWLLYREPFGRREALAMAVIFAGVAIVKRYSKKA